MEKQLSSLFDTCTINNRLKLKNRITFAPVYIAKHYTSREHLDFYAQRIEGGISLLFLPVNTYGGFDYLSSEEFIGYSKPLIEKSREHDCKIISHIFSGSGGDVNSLSTEELAAIPEQFAKAALSIKDTGFDGMEIHGAHYTLFMHLLSPLLNERDDCYGGSFENRTKLQVETVKKIRETVGEDFPLFYRFSAVDFVEGGVDLSITVPFAALLEEAGIDCIDISAGGLKGSPKHSDTPDDTYPDGCFAVYSLAVKQKVTIPVVVAGRIAGKEIAETIINEQKADLIGIGRGLVADPLWPQKVLQNKEDIIHLDQWWDLYQSFFR